MFKMIKNTHCVYRRKSVNVRDFKASLCVLYTAFVHVLWLFVCIQFVHLAAFHWCNITGWIYTSTSHNVKGNVSLLLKVY